MVQEDLGCLLSLSNNKIVIGITHREEKYSEGENQRFIICHRVTFIFQLFFCAFS